MKRLTYLIIALVLAASATGARGADPAQVPIDVDMETMKDYWSRVSDSITIDVPAVPDAYCGYVEMRFIVNPEGEVEDFEVLDAEPRRLFDKVARDQARAWRYEPTPANSARVPVRVTSSVTFDTNPEDDIDCNEIVAAARAAAGG